MAWKQKEKSRQTKNELMQSAVQVFGRKGFAASTISEITENAGYAKGNFYRYWKSKDDIFLDIMEKRLREYRASRQHGLQSAGSVQEALDVLIDFLESIIDDQNWSKVFLEFTTHAFSRQELKQKMNNSNYRLSSDLFSELLTPFTANTQECKKLGALVTALFDGYLIQMALGTRVLSKQDLRFAIQTLAKEMIYG
ncbi:MAG: TetR/AcrR family transcriptional regulator [Desulfohalobiaceae bacterium]